MKRIALAALLALPTAILSQNPAAAGPDSSARATAVRADRAPVIDGREDDAVWKSAPGTSDFREFQPKEGGPARFKTEFKAAYDDHNLYVFVRMWDPHPDSIMRSLSRRDVRSSSDQVKVMIDSYFDRRNGYEFAVNPDGVKRDYAIYNDRDEDTSWDAIWDVATRVDSAGWTAEYRFPLSQFRFTNKATHTFGFAIWRDIERYKERTSWPTYLSTRNGLTSQLGRLEGISGISQPTRLEIAPYTLGKATSRSLPATTPSGVKYDMLPTGAAGADIKYGVTSNLTLNATVYPDFGQVEADPSVLNLSAFETFFQERRPFFVEGVGLYDFGVNCSIVNCSGEGLFYSRRIGRSPQLSGLYGGTATATPIMGAGKLTGRFNSGLSIGVLDAVTQRVPGTLDRTIEPLTNYTVARAQQELRGGGTTIGVIGTAVNRSLDSWSESRLRKDAYVGGTDFKHKFGDGGKYEVSGSYMWSRISGDTAVIRRAQTDNVHLYQRPDGGLPFNPLRTELTGDAEEIHFAKLGGESVFRFQTNYQRRSAGFETNDLGFLRRGDEQSFNTWAALQFRKPTAWYRSLQMNFNEWSFFTTKGLNTENAVNTNWHLNAKNNWWWHLGGTVAGLGETYSDRNARGGPAVRRSAQFFPWFGFNWDDRAKFAPSLFFNFGAWDEGKSWYSDVSPSVDFRPSSAMQVSVGADYFAQADNSQYYGTFSDIAGTHYSFARLNQTQLSMSARVSYTMTPELTLQVYAAPFVTRGTYSDVRELSATPRAADYDARYQAFTAPAGSSAGFNVKEFKSNTVVRWEYRPGSTVFVVWTHGREGFNGIEGTNGWGREYGDLFALHPDNTFLIKVAYWLSL